MKDLNLYLLEQRENTGYDTYDSCVVVSSNEESARLITPSSWDCTWNTWASSPDKVTVTYLGVACFSLDEGDVICSSFNAG